MQDRMIRQFATYSVKQERSTWVYDTVTDRKGNIVAIFYHTRNHKDCLNNLADKLNKEDLYLNVSNGFDTREEAQQHAWTQRDRFIKGLD